MKPTTEQYERVGQFLDGQAIELSDAELELARQIRQDQQALGSALDCPMPASAANLLRRQAREALVRPRLKLRVYFNAAAAAAAVLLVVALVWPSHDRQPAGNVGIAHDPGLTAPANPAANELAVWAQDISQSDRGMYELMSAMTLDNIELEMAIESAAAASDPLTLADLDG